MHPLFMLCGDFNNDKGYPFETSKKKLNSSFSNDTILGDCDKVEFVI